MAGCRSNNQNSNSYALSLFDNMKYTCIKKKNSLNPINIFVALSLTESKLLLKQPHQWKYKTGRIH